MTHTHKKEIAALVEDAKTRLGSAYAASLKIGVSDATISLIRNPDKWEQVNDKMWLRVGSKLGWSPKSKSWELVGTANFRTVNAVCADAREHKLWLGISNRAGSGKTVALRHFAEMAGTGSGVFYIEAREWGRREFFQQLARNFGLRTDGLRTLDQMLIGIVTFLKTKGASLLIIDEADKLKSAAIRALIPIFNECKATLGVVIAGTEHLERDIRNQVRLQHKGSDEILSRFGRKFIHLPGADITDVAAICDANGVFDRELQKRIFQEAEPVSRVVTEGNRRAAVEVVEDLRRVERIIRREQLRNVEPEIVEPAAVEVAQTA